MAILTNLKCNNCSAQMDRADEYEKKLKCKYCGSIYQIESEASAGADISERLIEKTELRAVKPDDIEVSSSSNSLSFSRRWRKNGSYIQLAISLIWLTVILNQIAEVWLEGANASILFLLLFVGVGGLLLYRALSEIFNESVLTINKQTVKLETKPFTWKGDFTHAMDKIKHFEILPPPGPSISPSTKVFRICAITDDDRRLTLIPKLKNPGHAIYILREINQLVKKQ